MNFHKCLSDSKFVRVSRTFLSILFTKHLGIVLSTLVTIVIIFTFYSSFLILWQGLGTHPSFRFLIFSLYGSLVQQSLLFGKFSHFFFSFFFLSGCLAEICWSVCISKSKRNVCVSLSKMDSRLYVYHLFSWSNLNLFSQFQVDHLTHPVMSSLLHFCTNLMFSLIMWLMISSLSPNNLHLLFEASYLFSLWRCLSFY